MKIFCKLFTLAYLGSLYTSHISHFISLFIDTNAFLVNN